MEEALYDVPLYREFSEMGGMSRLPDRVSTALSASAGATPVGPSNFW